MSTNDAATAALKAEYAAIFVYGVVAAHAAASRSDAIAAATARHRARRDELRNFLAEAKVDVPHPALGYQVRTPITDPSSALTAALEVETSCAQTYRALLEQADTAPIKRTALDAMSENATAAGQWRLALKQSPATVPFPGGTEGK